MQQLELDGSYMLELSASGSDADANTVNPSVQIIEHEDIHYHEQSNDMVRELILPGRFGNEANDDPEVPESRYVSKIVIQPQDSRGHQPVDHSLRLIADFGRAHRTKSISGGRMWHESYL